MKPNTPKQKILFPSQKQNKEVIEKKVNVFDQFLNNKLIKHSVKTLLHRLLHQFRSGSYEVNSVLSHYRYELQQHKQSRNTGEGSNVMWEGKIQQVKEKDGHKEKYMYEFNEKEYSQLVLIWPEISIFLWELATSPKIYVHMLQMEELHADETESLDMHSFTTKIYKKVMEKITEMTAYCHLFETIAADQIYFFLEEVSLQICDCFAGGQSFVLKEIEYATDVVQKSQIMNFYILYKIFKDIASICRTQIIRILEQGMFRNIQMQIMEEFAHYIIEKYEVLKMEYDDKSIKGKDQEQKKQVWIIDRILHSNNIKWRQAIREDGQIGILVEIDDSLPQNKTDKQQQQQQEVNKATYMLRVNNDGQLSIMHSSSITQRWKVCKKAQQNTDIVKLIKNKKALAERMRSTSINPPAHLTLIDNINAIGGTFGRSLAEIGDYKSVGQFMGTLSKRMLIGGSISYMLTSVPLLGYVFITGGYTYSFYYIFRNKYANGEKKLRQIRNITLNAASSIGSGLLGAAVGQTLIPVPVLGAFIGGFVGGFIGQLSARTISNIFQTSRYKQLIRQLYDTIEPNGEWKVNEKTLDILEMKKQKFYDTIPKGLESRMNCDRKWLTLIFFVLLSFHQSKERIKWTEKKVKQMKKKESKMEEYEILEDGRQEQQQQYEPSLHFICILKYFQENGIILLDYHQNLADIIDKMFTRLK